MITFKIKFKGETKFRGPPRVWIWDPVYAAARLNCLRGRYLPEDSEACSAPRRKYTQCCSSFMKTNAVCPL